MLNPDLAPDIPRTREVIVELDSEFQKIATLMNAKIKVSITFHLADGDRKVVKGDYLPGRLADFNA